MMKSAAGKAFLGLGNKYRVGFVTINPNDPVSSTRFLGVGEFTIDQKKLWIEETLPADRPWFDAAARSLGTSGELLQRPEYRAQRGHDSRPSGQ